MDRRTSGAGAGGTDTLGREVLQEWAVSGNRRKVFWKKSEIWERSGKIWE